MSGAVMIAAERARQKLQEGFTDRHDDAHADMQLVDAARCYLAHAVWPEQFQLFPPGAWPWPHAWWKPSPDPIRDLVKAGALIAAEIDRRQRLAARAQATPPDEPHTAGPETS